MVQQKHFTYASTVRGIDVTGYTWEPEQESPRAVLVISHGMSENMARYDDFANFMAQQGIFVAGKDHLGHGATAQSSEGLGYFGPVEYDNIQNADFHKLVHLVRAMHPKTPLFILGHSMGSFLVREYITEHGEDLNGAIVCGSGDMNNISVSFGRMLVDFMSLFKGQTFRSRFVQKMMFGKFNSHIPNPRTPMDWLTRDTHVVDEYMRQRDNGFIFTLNGFMHMLLNISRVSQKQTFEKTPESLPILLIGGGEDPLGDWGRALPKLGKKYRAAGVGDVEVKLYPNDRHEVLNELDRDQVYADILEWMDLHLHG